MIPTFKFLEHSFRNWRGMQESGGRRIMRSISIDISSVRFLKQSENKRLKSSRLLKGYNHEKMIEVHTYNKEHLQTSAHYHQRPVAYQYRHISLLDY